MLAHRAFRTTDCHLAFFAAFCLPLIGLDRFVVAYDVF
jgi:hypothetical protein